MKLSEVKVDDKFKFISTPKKTFIVDMFDEFQMWYYNVNKPSKQYCVSFEEAEKIEIELLQSI